MNALSDWPLRARLIDWRIGTGDPPAVIATGFDLPVRVVEGLLDPLDDGQLSIDDAALICRRLRVDPRTIWGTRFTDQHEAAANWTPEEPFKGDRRYIPWPVP